jgi:hypothetical protein
MAEERKSSNFFKTVVPRARVPKKTEKSYQLVVTPDMLMTQFSNNYMECSALQKRGVKRHKDLAEKKLERDLTSTRQDWNSTLAVLLRKEKDLKELLESTGFECPPILLGIPSQQLERLEQLTFWARMILNNSKKPECENENTIRQLLDELCELKLRVKKQETRIGKLSSDLVLVGSHTVSNKYPDAISYNTEVFNVQEVLCKSMYEPALYDHNDVYFHFATPEDVVHFHNNLYKKSVREQCAPEFRSFLKLENTPPLTLEHLRKGFYVGLVVLTNLNDTSDGNHVVNYENMCLSCGEQVSGMFLQPGKKYVTWYIGQYSRDSAIAESPVWSQVVDSLFVGVQHSPLCWNQEFLKAWKILKPAQPMYACVLPGVKEVTLETWSSTDTLDWIVRNVDFWCNQLVTYSPSGYNLKLNNHFHRSLFMDTPQLMRFPILWQFKKSLRDLVSQVKDKQHFVLQNEQLLFYCRQMKGDFMSGMFHLIHYQWEKVKELMLKQQILLQESTQEDGKLRLMLDTLKVTLREKLNQAEALLRLDGIFVGTNIRKYHQEMLEVMETGEQLLRCEQLVEGLDITVGEMVSLDCYAEMLKGIDTDWSVRVCEEMSFEPDQFFTQFSVLKKRVKKTRTSHHPDKHLKCTDPDIQQYHLLHSWVVMLEAIEKLQAGFFSKCVSIESK